MKPCSVKFQVSGRTENGEKIKTEIEVVQLPLCILVFHNHRLNQPQIKNIHTRIMIFVLNTIHFFWSLFPNFYGVTTS